MLGFCILGILMKQRVLFALRYWPLWLVTALLWCLSHLPYRWFFHLGPCCGRLFARLSPRSHHNTLINIKTCFPELDRAAQQQLLAQSFRNLGIAIFETTLAWWGHEKRLRPLMHLVGMEHIRAAQANQRGILLLCAHQTGLELAGRLLALELPYSVTYLPPKHPFLNHVISQCRKRYYQQLIKKDDIRRLYKCLRRGEIVFYAADTDVGSKGVFVPFFDTLASTSTAVSRFVQNTNAVVLPTFFYRRSHQDGYDLIIHPPLSDFPGPLAQQDSARINRILETAILKAPEQYLWQYKRFKTRPQGEGDLYDPNS